MKFTIKRQTGAIGMVSKLAVYINDEKVDALALKEEKTFEIDAPTVTVRVGQSFTKSKPIEVSDNQVVLAKSSWFGQMFSIFGKNAFYLEIEN